MDKTQVQFIINDLAALTDRLVVQRDNIGKHRETAADKEHDRQLTEVIGNLQGNVSLLRAVNL